MAYICDDYFVRTIEVISERFKIPDDVAGATLMALGCNGPEMALNTISIFNPSDIGIGAVIGGEVFNVLVIIGTAMLATPEKYLPLRISNFSFFRDVFFLHGISVDALCHFERWPSISNRGIVTNLWCNRLQYYSCKLLVYSPSLLRHTENAYGQMQI
jgi:Ca2+/Na+ antiporter